MVLECTGSGTRGGSREEPEGSRSSETEGKALLRTFQGPSPALGPRLPS